MKYKTNEIGLAAGDINLRGVLRGCNVDSHYTCKHSHPAGYGQGHTMFFESDDESDFNYFLKEAQKMGYKLTAI